MSKEIDYDSILSPCNNRCQMDFENTFCLSCLRTLEEKKNWWRYTKAEKEKIIEELKTR